MRFLHHIFVQYKVLITYQKSQKLNGNRHEFMILQQDAEETKRTTMDESLLITKDQLNGNQTDSSSPK